MDHAARVAFVQAQTVCAMAEIEAMKAANRQREIVDASPAYTEDDFRNVPGRFQISWNTVIEYLREG